MWVQYIGVFTKKASIKVPGNQTPLGIGVIWFIRSEKFVTNLKFSIKILSISGKDAINV